MHLTLFTWPPFIAAILNSGLAAGALWRNRHSAAVRVFAAWNIVVAVWNVATLELFTITDPVRALEATRWARNFIVFIPTLFLHLVLRLLRNHTRLNQRLLAIAYGSSVLFMISNNIDGLFVRSMQHYYWGFYPLAGPVGMFYPLSFFLCVGYAIFAFYREAHVSTGFHRNQCRFLFVATLLVFASAATNFLDVLGVSIYPFGNVISIVYSIVFAYAIVTFGLIDIQMAFRRTLVYGSLAGALTGTYVLIESLIKRMFMEHDALSSAYAFHLAAVPITLALAPRVRSTIEPLVLRLPFWTKHDRNRLLKEFNQTILSTFNIYELARSLVHLLSRSLEVEKVALFVQVSAQSSLDCLASAGPTPPRLGHDHPAVEYLKETHRILYREKLLWEVDNRERLDLSPTLIGFLKESSYEVLIPLFFQMDLIGVIALGPKISQEMYNVEDFGLLETLTGQITVAVSHARAIQTLKHQQNQIDLHKETVLMGTMATEMAHELAKPLTHIMNEGSRLGQKAEGRTKEGLSRIEKEAQRAAEILDGFSLLSPERPLHQIALPLKDLLEESINALGINEDKTIQIVRHYKDCPPVFVNPGQIVQVFTNVIQNAWQAMRHGGTLSLILDRSSMGAQTLMDVVIEDTGPGISPELLKNVFQPFFTTKRAQGGRGVGLTISRAMVERHDGSMGIESPIHPEGGTRVRITLPMAKKETPNGH